MFLDSLNDGDVAGIASLYEAEAVVAPEPGQLVRGRPAIRAMLDEFLHSKPKFALHDVETVQTADVALVRSRWTCTMKDASGKRVKMEIAPLLVARRQADGRWLVAIDRPLGAAPEAK